MDILEPGGLIVSDNVLFKGMVASDKLVVRRKNHSKEIKGIFKIH